MIFATANAIGVRLQEAVSATGVGEVLVNLLLGCFAFPLLYAICAAIASGTVDSAHGKGKGYGGD